MNIIKYGNPILRLHAAPIEEIDDSVKELVDNMIQTMQEHEGVGLAAPQVAESKALFVVDLSLIEEDGQPIAIINPKIISKGKEETTFEEGCLSVPGIREEVKRPSLIKVRYQDIEGKIHEEELSDLKARVFQHEYDHLHGVFFVDRLGSMKRKLLQKQLKQIADEELNMVEESEMVS